MTDLPPHTPQPGPSSDDADLLASLYLDGEATPEERARVDADPALRRRVEEFRRLSAELATPPPVPSGLAATQIAAALAAFDETRVPAAASTTTRPSNVSSLSDRRERRAGLPAWLGAAAVATLVVGGLGFVASRGGDDDEAASVETSLSASAAGADDAADATSTSAQRVEAAEAGAAEAELMDDLADEEASDDGDAATDGADDDSLEEAAPLDGDEAEAFYAENGPINLADLEATTAAGFYEQLLGLPLQPIEASPCADSPLIAELSEVDSFIPVVFDRRPASLVLRADDPSSTATIVGPTCEVELD